VAGSNAGQFSTLIESNQEKEQIISDQTSHRPIYLQCFLWLQPGIGAGEAAGAPWSPAVAILEW